MRLSIVRHAKAAHDSPTGADADRPLKARGHRQAEALGAFFASRSPTPMLVLSSPYLRARETSEHVWSALELDPQLDDRLSADRHLDDYLAVIADLAGCSSAAIVGHNPLVARLVAVLLEGPTAETPRHETARVVTIDLGDPMSPIGTGVHVESFRPEE